MDMRANIGALKSANPGVRLEGAPSRVDLGRILDQTYNEIYIFDPDTLKFRHANQGALRNLGYSTEEMSKLTPVDIKPSVSSLQFRKMVEPLLNGKKDLVVFETAHMRKDQSIYPVEVRVQYSEVGNDPVFVAVVQDITERKQAEETIWRQANYDTLTGLPNRAVFFDRLEMAENNAERDDRMVALMFIDLDNFKDINDTEGHTAGDLLLVEASKRFRETIRKTDTVARIGGDEFAVIQTSIRHVDDAEQMAQKILDCFKEPFNLAGKDVYAGASIGITLYPLDDQGPEELVRNADIAMYAAKEKGRNTYKFYSAEMSTVLQERNAMERDLRAALEENQFYLDYQPKVLTGSGVMAGVEALVRWNHPTRGLVPPGDFIPLSERTGQILQLGEWVLREACAQNKAWQDMGLGKFSVAVNLSAVQFKQKGLADKVARILNETGLEAQYLELEITEGTAMHDASAAAIILDDLSRLGIKISLDDFGTGYSSLAYLKRFPLDRIKIDMSFVLDLLSDANDAAIVNSIVMLGKSLDMKVTAEGVETAEQLEHLSDCGCDEVQGFHLGRPMTSEALAEFVRNR